MSTSPLETRLLADILAAGLPTPHRELAFRADRKWRFDFAWLEAQVAMEVEGGIWTQGRHTRARGFTADIEKLNTAALDGWLVLRVTGEHIRSGMALQWLRQAFSAFYGDDYTHSHKEPAHALPANHH